MEIISRADAKRRGDKYYFTGKACINGHSAWRYVSTGGCSHCIAESGGRSAIERRHNPRHESLIVVNVVIYPEQLPLLLDTARALCESVYPEGDFTVLAGQQSIGCLERKYMIRVPPQYVEMFRDTARALHSSSPKRPDVEAARTAALAHALAIVGAG